VIPKFYGFYEIWGILKLLALEPGGDAIPEGEIIDQGLRTKMRTALRCIHNAGFVHGDIARRNFCRTESGNVFWWILRSVNVLRTSLSWRMR
jgi:hypothetical protein